MRRARAEDAADETLLRRPAGGLRAGGAAMGTSLAGTCAWAGMAAAAVAAVVVVVAVAVVVVVVSLAGTRGISSVDGATGLRVAGGSMLADGMMAGGMTGVGLPLAPA